MSATRARAAASSTEHSCPRATWPKQGRPGGRPCSPTGNPIGAGRRRGAGARTGRGRTPVARNSASSTPAGFLHISLQQPLGLGFGSTINCTLDGPPATEAASSWTTTRNRLGDQAGRPDLGRPALLRRRADRRLRRGRRLRRRRGRCRHPLGDRQPDPMSTEGKPAIDWLGCQASPTADRLGEGALRGCQSRPSRESWLQPSRTIRSTTRAKRRISSTGVIDPS
jgi:hypothetical protein